jgi:hypothetical protein
VTVDVGEATAIVVALVSAVFTWLRTRDVEKLRADIAATETRLRHDLARDLAAHESALRIQNEIRLRLFERSVTAIDRALVALHGAGREILAEAERTAARDPSPPRRPPKNYRRLFSHMAFLPPALDREFLQARDAVDDAAMASVVLSEVNPFGDALGKMTRAVEGFEASARRWKDSNWMTGDLKSSSVALLGDPKNAP